MKSRGKSFLLSKGIFSLFLISVLFFIPERSSAQFYQGYQMGFGKNRIQYNSFFWTFYRLKQYDIYFYAGGQELADFTSKAAVENLDKIEKLLDYKLEGRVQFVIFNKLSDMRQSNIGLSNDESYNIGGTTKIVGNKIFLYFDGSHENLEKQIRAGIAQILVNQILYGGDIKDMLQNAALLTLPDWYVSGLASYLSNNWDVEIDNRVKDGILNGKYKSFNRLSGDDAIYAGHSIWAYIVEIYGEQALSNLLYMTRVNRNIESGFLFVLGLSSRALSQSWNDYYIEKYKDEENGRVLPANPLKIKSRNRQVNYQMKLSPDGTKIAYVANELGRFKLNIYDLQTGKKKTILKGGYKTLEHKTDESYPLLAWNPDGKTLSFITEKNGKIYLTHYDLVTHKKAVNDLFNFDKILDFSYSDNGQNIVMSSVKAGASDIVVYSLRSRTTDQVTHDRFDDFNPRFINHSRQIVFSSTRSNDSLQLAKSDSSKGQSATDIFIYDYKTRSKVLRRVTNTPGINELNPSDLDSSDVVYLGEENGIRNRYVAHLDSAISFVDTTEHYRDIVEVYPVTDYQRNILFQDVNVRTGKQSEIIYANGKYHFYVSDAPKANPQTKKVLENTPFRKRDIVQRQLMKTAELSRDSAVKNPKVVIVKSPMPDDLAKPAIQDTSGKIDIDNYVFQNEFQYHKRKKEPVAAEIKSETITDTSVFVKKEEPVKKAPGILKRNYNTSFSANYLQLMLDNSLLSPTYQLYTGTGSPVTFSSGINITAKLGINDLFEDYRVTGAVRFAGDFRTLGYYVSVENLKKRLDKQLTYYREGRLYTFPNSDSKDRITTNELKYMVKWPFSEVTAIRGTFGVRNDRLVFLSTDINALREPNQYQVIGMAKGEFIFDNTISRGLNLYNGIRFKVFCEVLKPEQPVLRIETPTPFMVNPGFDFRYYQKVHREIVWANRVAAASSIGKEKVVYYLGATDNWFNPKFNTSIPVDNSQNYVFQALATNLRGFDQNIRNGNSFAVINSELRVPVFKYLFARPIKSDFIKNFQVVGFGDIGSAWTGISPFDSTNSLNSKVIVTSPLKVTLINQRQPVVGGYGFGLRSRILGYFARIDWAWGVDDGITQKRIVYFSLSLDF